MLGNKKFIKWETIFVTGEQPEWENLIKRPFIRAPEYPNVDMSHTPVSSLWSEQLLKMLMKPASVNYPDPKAPDHGTIKQKPDITPVENIQIDNQNCSQNPLNPLNSEISTFVKPNEPPKVDSTLSVVQQNQSTSSGQYNDNICQTSSFSQINPWVGQSQFDSIIMNPLQINTNQFDCTNFDNLDWNLNPVSSQLAILPQQDIYNLPLKPNSNNFRDLSVESYTQSDIYSSLNGGSTIVDPSISSMILDDFSKEVSFQKPSEFLLGNYNLSQDIQSQITSASMENSRAFSFQEIPDSSNGASSSNVEFDESSLLPTNTWQPAPPPVRTYTKIQKSGSVGRSIDVSSFTNYDELLSSIELMFGLESLLNDRGSGWKVVYVDFEKDVLLVGDDPWEEFVSCVRCIRILSPTEVQKMSEEGMQLLNSAAAFQGNNGLMPESG